MRSVVSFLALAVLVRRRTFWGEVMAGFALCISDAIRRAHFNPRSICPFISVGCFLLVLFTCLAALIFFEGVDNVPGVRGFGF